MYTFEGFLRNQQGTPALRFQPAHEGKQTFSPFTVPLDHFTPLTLRYAPVQDGATLLCANEQPLRLFTPTMLRGLTPTSNLPLGYLTIPSVDTSFRGYQLVAYPGVSPSFHDEIPEGFVPADDTTYVAFTCSDNREVYRFPVTSLVPFGKPFMSRARHATQLQQELQGALTLGLRQRRNLEAVSELPAENGYIHAGCFLEGKKGLYTGTLVIAGHVKH